MLIQLYLSIYSGAQVAREIQIHKGLDHPHIVQLYAAFEDSKHVYLVQEFAAGDGTRQTEHAARCARIRRCTRPRVLLLA
jgi:serine/threonine protein kinase